jgi:hypothetical protein
MKRGFGVVIFPLSWHIGYWPREKKNLFAFGPIRFVLYKATGEWKS